MSSLPKAALYYFPKSIWSSVVLLTLEEKGYGPDEIDLRIVDIWQGEHYDTSFLRLNPKGTVPTLVVPLSNTLSEEIDSRYKAITESTAIVEFLDKSRSALSRTHTTSTAPAPTLTPATIAASSICKTIIELLHTPEASPGPLTYFNARNEEGLRNLSALVLRIAKTRQEVLSKHLDDASKEVIHVSEKVSTYWQEKSKSVGFAVRVLGAADKALDELSDQEKEDRAIFFDTAKRSWEKNLPLVLLKLSKEMIAPFALGDQFSIADLHLAAWFTRIAKLAGANAVDNGEIVIDKIEKYVGAGLKIPRDYRNELNRSSGHPKQAKLQAFWDAIKERPSWQKLYGEALY